MRKSLLLLVALGPLAALAGLALPAAAESDGGSCASHVSQAATTPLDLDKIPAKAVVGHQAVSGVAIDDECDDVGVIGKAGADEARAAINADDRGRSREGHTGNDD